MAGKKENIKALFTNTRSRVIILFTVIVILIAVIVGFVKFSSIMRPSAESSASVGGVPSIQSVPGAINPTAQYVSLQETQNVQQAEQAATSGNSAIPTIIRTQAFGEGVERIGPQGGEGAVGFGTLARDYNNGAQQSLWLQSLKENNCSKASIDSVVSQGGGLSDLKVVCSCVQLKDTGYKFTDLEPVCSCTELKASGFNARQMKDAGFTANRLRQCGFDACELRGAGYTAQDMADGGFSDGELKGAGFPDSDIERVSGLPDGITTDNVRKAECQQDALSRLRTAGVTASAIRRISGCSIAQLKAAEFSVQDMKNAGFSAADLINAAFSPEQLKNAGYGARDLLNAGLTPSKLIAAGFTPDQLKAAETELPPGMTKENIKEAGCDVEALKRQRLAGVSAALIHQNADCSVQSLKSAGFTETDLANAGFTPTQISMSSSLVSDDAIKAAGCGPTKLKGLFLQGASAKRIHDLNSCNADVLKQAGFSAKDLIESKFTPQQLIAAGFAVDQVKAAELSMASSMVSDDAIKTAGCDPTKLKGLFLQGASAKRINELNACSADVLKQAGYDAKDLIQGGFTPQQLIAAGFAADLVKAAELNLASSTVSDDAIKAAGCDPTKLNGLFLQGASAKRINELNACSADALKQAGFSAKDLIQGGFTPQQLIAAGFAADQVKAAELSLASSMVSDDAIKAASCDPTKLKGLFLQGASAKRINELNACSADVLKQAGYDAKDLIQGGFTPQQLIAAGFAADLVKAAELNLASSPVSDDAIKAAGCDPTKLKGLFLQGASAKRINELNTCSADTLKQAGFSAKDLIQGGFTPQQLITAGFAADQVKAAALSLASSMVSDDAIKAAGCDPTKLKGLFLQGASAKRINELNACRADVLKQAGYDAKDLIQGGFTPQQLVAAGFAADLVKAAQLSLAPSTVSDEAIKAAGCDPTKLKGLFLQGASAKRINELNACSADTLKQAGYDAKDLIQGGFTPQQLIAAGFAADLVKAAQLSLAPSTVSDDTIKAAGCDPTKLKGLFLQGASAKRINELNACSADALKQAGFSAKDLIQGGFTPQQLIGAGFAADLVKAAQLSLAPLVVSDDVIKAAGCDPTKLKELFLQGASAKRINELNACSADAIKQAGFSAKDLIQGGFTPQQLIAAGFAAEQVKAAQLSLTASPVSDDAIKAAGCDPTKLKGLFLQGASATRINALNACSADTLKQAGFSAKDLIQGGFTPQQLISAGFAAEQVKAAQLSLAPSTVSDDVIKAAGCDPTKLKGLFLQGASARRINELNACSADTLKQAGYDAKDLIQGGFTPQQLITAGFAAEQVKAAQLSLTASPVSDDAIKAAGCDPTKLKGLFLQGASATRINVLNACSADTLKQAGFSAKDLIQGGFTPQQLISAGFAADLVKAAQLSLAPSTVSDDVIKAAGCDPTKLKGLFLQGASARRINELNACSADTLKQAGYDAKDLIQGGFTPQQLITAGFAAEQVKAAQLSLTASPVSDDAIKAAGCDPTKLKGLFLQGASAKRINELNACSANTLKQAGYDAKDLIQGGFTPQELITAGFAADLVKAAQLNLASSAVSDDVIKAAGCDPTKLKGLFLQGASAKRINELNACSADTLKQAGYDAKDLIQGGFTPQQLINAGFAADLVKAAQLSLSASPVSDDAIKAAGCDPTKLKGLFLQGASATRINALNACSADTLKQAGFSAKDLIQGGFTPQQLITAGFAADLVKAAQLSLAASTVSDDAIKAAGCDPTKLNGLFLQGASAKRINELNACNADALKQAGFSAKDLIQGGFMPQQLIAAGFSADLVKAAQLSLTASPISDDVIKAAGCDPTKLNGLFLQGASAKRINELNACSADALKQAGYDAKDLIQGGFTPQQLIAAGFAADQVKAAQLSLAPSAVSDDTIKAAGCDPTKLKGLFLQGAAAKRINELNACSADTLKQAGFSAKDLIQGGLTPQQLIAAGFAADLVKAAQLSLASSGVRDDAIKTAGCDPLKLKELFLQGASAKRINELSACSADALKQAGYDAKDLIQGGFTPQQLTNAGFAADLVKAAQLSLAPSAVSDDAIKAAGCDPTKLKGLFLQGASAKRINELNTCSADVLKQAGFSAKDLIQGGFTPQQLVATGFAADLVKAAQLSLAASAVSDDVIKAAGCDPTKLKGLFLQGASAKRINELNACSADTLKQVGYDAKDLIQGGFMPQQLINAGFAADLVKAAQLSLAPSAVSDDAIKGAGCDPTKLKGLFLQGASAKRINELNTCNADVLKQAGFSAKDLIQGGFTPQQLMAAGFAADQVKVAQMSAVASAVSDDVIKVAGCDPVKLKGLFAQGASAKRINELNACSADALKKAGYDVKTLADAGFTPAELLAIGFSPQQLTQAGLNPSDIIATGRTSGCSVESLKAAHALGVSAITIKQTLGCNAAAMEKAAYSAVELKAAGFTTAELKDAGISVDVLKKAGFGAKELAAAGFSAEQLKNTGYTVEQLKDAGFGVDDLKKTGLSVKAMKAAGFSAAALKDAGISAEELRKEGYTTQELQDAGFTPQNSSLAGLQSADQPAAPKSELVLPPVGGSPVASAEINSEIANTKQLEDIMKRQQTVLADQRYQQKIQQRTSAMMAAAGQSLAEWKSVPSQAYVAGSPPKEVTASARGGASLLNEQTMSEETINTKGRKMLIGAGDVLFAVLDTSVNSDEPGPILATIVSGKLKGAKLIGSFVLPTNANKMVINFNTMSVPGAEKTTSINAYGIDPNTARTALSSKTNHHYLVRYGSLFASTFLEGFGNAFQSANTTISIGGTGGGAGGINDTTITNGVGRSVLDNAVIGMATLGKSWGQVAQRQFNTPITVEVYSGTAIGVLFTQDLKSL